MKKVESKRFQVLSGEATRLKETEGGLTSMCQVMQHYEAVARKEGLMAGHAAGLAEGREKERVEILKGMIGNGMTLDAAMKIINIPTEKWAEYRRKVSAC